MVLQCRTCAKVIYNNNPTNIFATENFQVLSNIQMIAGTALEEIPGLPMHICACCLVDVKRAIFHTKTFRERCNRTQEQLQSLLSEHQSDDDDDGQEHMKEEISSVFEKIFPKPNEYIADNLVELEVPSTNDDGEDDSDMDPDFLTAIVKNEVKSIDTYSSECQDSEEEIISDLDNDFSPNAIEVDEQTITENTQLCSSNQENKNHREDCITNTPKVKRYRSWKNLTEEQIVERKRQQRRRDCICDQCGKHFTDQSNFKLHMIRHTGIKNFECQRCSKRFYTDHLLQLHERIVHQGERPYGCKYCNKTFHNSTSRAVHERHHTNLRPFSCDYCEKEFISASDLKRHILIHNGIRAFFCEICNKNFQRSTHLKAHLKSKLHALKANGDDTLKESN
ncbi:transcription factor Ouib isoform X1 [Drosophila albomicans]|uniref:Transcription factor Ouib isoform X1 n=1 Tax=Drosophila albomicans TaxID=7291 RepID=A0A6P8XIT5_DROAB|nr:transcription factor Ouib isoform X1 [Drosophila albomicans]